MSGPSAQAGEAGEAADTANLLEAARVALETYLEVHVDDDGTLTFSHGAVPGVVQAMSLADGLVVLSLTCVVGWDLPDEPGLAAAVAERAGEGLFGTLGVVRTDRGLDVTLRYTFPGHGLGTAALGTLLMLAISAASQARADLVRDVA